MTTPPGPGRDAREGGRRGQDPGPDRDAHAEAVLSQALRAMAGGRRDPAGPGATGAGGESATDRSSSYGSSSYGSSSYRGATDSAPGWWSQLTVTQIVLVAAIIGLVLGMAAAFTVLLTG